MQFKERADIARGTIGVGAPLEVALFAIVIAALTIFATLATPQFRKAMPKWKIIMGVFLWSACWIAVSLIVDVLLYLSTYVASFVESGYFVALGTVAVWLFVYSVFLTLLCAHQVARQMLGIAMLPPS